MFRANFPPNHTLDCTCENVIVAPGVVNVPAKPPARDSEKVHPLPGLRSKRRNSWEPFKRGSEMVAQGKGRSGAFTRLPQQGK